MSRRRWVSAIAAGALLAGLVAWATLRDDGSDEGAAPPGSSTTTSVPSSTSLPPGMTPLDTTTVVWPTAASGARFTDPVAAARSFALDYLGFADPIVGAFQPAASGTGEVELRARAGGRNVTLVQLRQLEPDDDWWVLGATTANIELTQPAALDAVTSPVLLRGQSTAFEATVNVEIRADDQQEPLARSYVMGGSMGELGPFASQLAFDDPGAAANGAIVLATYSAEDGSLAEATVVRVRFGEPRPDGRQTTACGEAPARAPLAPGQTEVKVFFTCGDPATPPQPAFRVVPATTGVLRASLEQLLVGPTPNERALGFASPFSAATFGMVTGVDLDPDGSATVDLDDLRTVVPDAASGPWPAMLLAQLDATVFQFPTVRSVVYRFDGDCQLFATWLHLGSCAPRRRP